MKIICFLLIALCFMGCVKNSFKDDLTFVPEKSMNIQGLDLKKKTSLCIGSYTSGNDLVISKYKLQAKYSLFVVKLKNVSQNCSFNNYQKPEYSTPGYFATVDESLYEVNLSPQIFGTNDKITQIDFIADQKIIYHIDTDSIKSFDVKFNKLVIKINDDADKVIYGKIEYYGLKSLDAQILFYRVKDKSYLFMMTPIKTGTVLEHNYLYNHLFN